MEIEVFNAALHRAASVYNTSDWVLKIISRGVKSVELSR